jgi:hypothetical protein
MTVSKREFTSARHAQRRALCKACREVCKGTPWRSASGVLFAQRNGWFLALHEMTNIVREETRARFVVKPMAIDPIFWDLVGEPQLRSESLSFRYFGALTCPGLIIGEPDIGEEGGPPSIAGRMLERAEAKLDEVALWTTDEFLRGIEGSVNPGRLFATTIATLISAGRADDALARCEEAIARQQVGGFLGRRGSFPETAAAWIRAA